MEKENISLPVALPISVFLYPSEVVDDEGRPLRETHADATIIDNAVAQGVLFETRPFVDRRSPSRTPGGQPHEFPYDASALKQVMEHKEDLDAGIGFFRDYVREKFPSNEQLSLQGIYLMSTLGVALPTYLLYRVPHPLRGDVIPAASAVLHKSMMGIRAACEIALVNRGLAATNITADTEVGFYMGMKTIRDVVYHSRPVFLRPEELLHEIEHDEVTPLVGGNRVCAAPQKLIMNVLETIIEGSNNVISENDRSVWRQWIPNIKQYEYFSLLLGEVERRHVLFELFKENLMKYGAVHILSQLVEVHSHELRRLQTELNVSLGRTLFTDSEE